MLEKAKNRKIFYFLVFIILAASIFIIPVSATTYNFADARNYYHNTWDTFVGHRGASSCDGVSTIGSYTQAPFQQATSSSGQFNGFNRLIIKIDTSSMTDDYIQNGVQLRVRTYNWNADCAIVALTGTPTYDVSEWDNIFDLTSNYAETGSIIDVPATSIDAINITSEFPFNTEGYTYIGVLTEKDYNNDTTWASGQLTSSGMYIWGTYAGYLTVESEEASKTCSITTDKSSGNLPLEVTFTDTSDGFSESTPYDDYVLSFGDGSYWAGEWQYSGENWFHTYHYAGTYNYSYSIVSDGTTYYSNGTITVSDSESNYYVEVHGLNTAPIEGANVSIWYNGEYQDSEGSSSIGRAYFTIPPYRFVNGTVTKPGYQTAYFDTYIYPDDNWETVTLYADNETFGSGDSYGNYIVTFKDASDGDSVGYSNIEVYSDSGYTTLFYDEYSNSGGVWTGLMPMNVTYYYKYPETTSYYSQSWSYNLTVSPAYKTVNLVPKSTATSTPTPTPTVTATTITPTVTYTFNDGNLSSLNVKERMTNLFVLAGFQNAESADLIFAMIIVLGCTALIGWITLSGSGAGMGAIIGFVFSLGLGLIPLWLLIAAIFLGCLYVALKLFGGSGE